MNLILAEPWPGDTPGRAQRAIQPPHKQPADKRNVALRRGLKTRNVLRFFEQNRDPFLEMCEIVDGGHRVSLRTLDFLCTKHAAHRYIPVVDPAGVTVDLFSVYSHHLRSCHKHSFDAFKRGPRTDVQLHDRTLVTTLGQMSFFRMLFRYRVLDYTVQHLPQIEDAMSRDLRCVRQRAKQTKLRREAKKRHRASTEAPVVAGRPNNSEVPRIETDVHGAPSSSNGIGQGLVITGLPPEGEGARGSGPDANRKAGLPRKREKRPQIAHTKVLITFQ